MPKYVLRATGWVDPATGEAMPVPDRNGVCLPRYTPDTPGYASPITGEWIEGRSARREDLKKHNCVEAGDMPRLNGGKMRSEKFARKHGLPWQGD